MDSEPAGYVAADLAHPDGLAVVEHRAPPEAQVVALMDIVARLLQPDVLRPAKQVEVADRRVRVSLPRHSGSHYPHHRALPGYFRRAPAAAHQRGEGVLDTADDDEVERVAIARPILIRGATRQGFQRRGEF